MGPAATTIRPGGVAAETKASVASRGRPRRPETDSDIVKAVFELLGETGLAGLSMDAVARRAGVGKATIYRRWPSKEALVLHALQEAIPTIADPDTGTLRGDLTIYVDAFVASGRGRSSDVFAHVLAAAHHNDDLNDTLQRYLRRRHAVLERMLGRAIERGELPPDIDVATALDAIVGPIVYRKMVPGRTVDRRFVRRLVDLIVR